MTPEVPPLVVGIDGSERSLDALAAGSTVAHHADPAAPAMTQPDPAA